LGEKGAQHRMRNDEGNLVDADLSWFDENSFDATMLHAH
jgi:hypothetical protein